MKLWTIAALALVTVGTLGSLAFGQGEGADNQLNSFQMMDNVAVLVTPAGRVVRRSIADPDTSAMILKDARPMSAGTVLFMHGGKVYLTTDKPGPHGKTLAHMMMQGAK